MKAILIVLVFTIVVVSGCTQNPQEKTRAETACILLCKLELQRASDLSKGPCLSGTLIENWVCDVAHSPREPVDDLPQNQCPEFGKTAAHFVEVNEDCEVIRSI